MLLGLLLLSVNGCTARLPPSAALPAEPDLVAIEAAVQSWRHSSLPWSQTCDDEFDRIRVVVSMPGEFTELCGRRPVNAGGKLYACNTEQYRRSFPFWLMDDARVPLLVISRLQPEPHRRVLIIHEAMHWMERCSGKGIDFEHTDERVWQSARLMAQRLLRMNERQYRLVQSWMQEDQRLAQAAPAPSDGLPAAAHVEPHVEDALPAAARVEPHGEGGLPAAGHAPPHGQDTLPAATQDDPHAEARRAGPALP